ncbi:helix-turn-helix domain-containing protein [Domibacillus aminovorans]|nr:helix-turn-helix domain-containing protein [Domibacillus aminovorans]
MDNPYKFRIYPYKEKEILIIKTIGCSPFLFNHFLAKWNNTYKITSKG